METQSKHAKSAKFNKPAIGSVLPESVTYDNIVKGIAPATMEDLVLALNSMIQECEISTYFPERRKRELQILGLLLHDLLAEEFGRKTAALFDRLFERHMVKLTCDSVALLYAIERGIMEYEGVGRTIESVEQREIDLIKQFRDTLLESVLGQDGGDLAKELCSVKQ